MCKFPSSIFALIIWSFFQIDRANSQDYDPFVLISNASTSHHMNLPYEAYEENNKVVYPKKTKYNDNTEYSFLCPPETQEEAKKYVLDSWGNYSQADEHEYCLVKTSDSPIKCKNKPKPLFKKEQYEKKPQTRCGTTLDQLSYVFGYNYCTIRGKGKPFHLMVSMYDLCIDTAESEVLWTSHEVQTGVILRPPGLPSQEMKTPEPEDLSKEPFSLWSKKYFVNIAEEYKNQAPGTYTMVPQLLVPQEDMALKLWKIPTFHYMNTSSLWKELVPLMNTINKGIRKAAIQVTWASYQIKEAKTQSLLIYTRAITYPQLSGYKKLFSWIYSLFKRQQIGLNIWCKFVYNELTKEGVMIYLHNLPEHPPVESDPNKPEESPEKELVKKKECDKPASCNFKRWLDEDEREHLLNEFLKYAYCCEVDNKKVKELFNLTLTDKIKLLNIDDYIKDESNSENGGTVNINESNSENGGTVST